MLFMISRPLRVYRPPDEHEGVWEGPWSQTLALWQQTERHGSLRLSETTHTNQAILV